LPCYPSCCICGKDLTGTSWLCNEHAQKWGVTDKPFQKWPDWLKYLASTEYNERRYETKAQQRACTISQSRKAQIIAWGEWIDDDEEGAW
jgi:hypothetical protein